VLTGVEAVVVDVVSDLQSSSSSYGLDRSASLSQSSAGPSSLPLPSLGVGDGVDSGSHDDAGATLLATAAWLPVGVGVGVVQAPTVLVCAEKLVAPAPIPPRTDHAATVAPVRASDAPIPQSLILPRSRCRSRARSLFIPMSLSPVVGGGGC